MPITRESVSSEVRLLIKVLRCSRVEAVLVTHLIIYKHGNVLPFELLVNIDSVGVVVIVIEENSSGLGLNSVYICGVLAQLIVK